MVQQESSAVDRLYSDFSRILGQIEATDISLRNSAEEIFQKSLLMAAASYFERRITDDLLAFVDEVSTNTSLVAPFVRNQAIERKYHTLFSWDSQNANKFFGLFGQDFKTYMTEYVRNNADYESAIRAFMEIGRERNRIVHEDFGSVRLEKTTEEIYKLYKQALIFVEQIPILFKMFEQNNQTS